MGLSMKAYEQLLTACVTSGAERRDATRTAVSIEVAITCSASDASPITSVQLVDVSQDGFGFVTEKPVRTGQSVYVDLPVPGSAPVRLAAEVRHCRESGHQKFIVGARFADSPFVPANAEPPAKTESPRHSNS